MYIIIVIWHRLKKRYLLEEMEQGIYQIVYIYLSVNTIAVLVIIILYWHSEYTLFFQIEKSIYTEVSLSYLFLWELMKLLINIICKQYHITLISAKITSSRTLYPLVDIAFQVLILLHESNCHIYCSHFQPTNYLRPRSFHLSRRTY